MNANGLNSPSHVCCTVLLALPCMHTTTNHRELLSKVTPELPQPLTFGSVYGSWSVIPLPSLHRSTIISCGVGEDVSFDVEFAAYFDAVVVLVDPTPKSVDHYREAVEARLGKRATASYSSSGRYH